MIGAELFDQISNTITGRIAITRQEAEFLAGIAGRASLYLEIGTLWGGTAILAALAGARRVITLDAMAGGYWEHGDPVACRTPTPGLLLDNLARCQVAHRVSVVKANSHPWPLPLDLRPDVFLIDGDHRCEGCLHDWAIANQVAAKFLLFHDYDSPRHPGVQEVVDRQVRPNPGWRLVDVVETLAVFERLR